MTADLTKILKLNEILRLLLNWSKSRWQETEGNQDSFSSVCVCLCAYVCMCFLICLNCLKFNCKTSWHFSQYRSKYHLSTRTFRITATQWPHLRNFMLIRYLDSDFPTSPNNIFQRVFCDAGFHDSYMLHVFVRSFHLHQFSQSVSCHHSWHQHVGSLDQLFCRISLHLNSSDCFLTFKIQILNKEPRDR